MRKVFIEETVSRAMVPLTKNEEEALVSESKKLGIYNKEETISWNTKNFVCYKLGLPSPLSNSEKKKLRYWHNKDTRDKETK